jgi:hypothetical protein
MSGGLWLQGSVWWCCRFLGFDSLFDLSGVRGYNSSCGSGSVCSELGKGVPRSEAKEGELFCATGKSVVQRLLMWGSFLRMG